MQRCLYRNINLLGLVAFTLYTMSSLGRSTTFAQDVDNPWPSDPYLANDRAPDERYKTDVLVVVAHPDDEIMAAAYIARLVDQGKRVSLIWTTRGDGGTNDLGPEQAAALGDIREVEAFRAGSFLGLQYMWNLAGPDTPSQNPLESLETCNHGRCLYRLVRLVRLTRPDVILTWLPLSVTGENHGDHQASGIMATEAFDMAGDPTVFSEQLAPAREPKKNMNRLEGLHPWQPQKIYYFSNPTHTDFFEGQGPQYPNTDISPTRHISYARLAAEEFGTHLTQGGGKMEKALRLHGDDVLKSDRPIPLDKSKFIFGKSLVPSGVTDDVFTGIAPSGLPFHPAPGYKPVESTAPTLDIGGVWHFYDQWRQAHGLEHISHLIPAEVSIQVGQSLSFPLLIDNPLDKAITVKFDVQAPQGWTVTLLGDVSVGPHNQFVLRLQAAAPATKLKGWQQFQVTARCDGKSLGSVPLRVELADWALPQ